MLISTSKNALSFLLCLCLPFNKIAEKGRTVSLEAKEGRGKKKGAGGRGEKWPRQHMHI
jgi:hypothetical protein